MEKLNFLTAGIPLRAKDYKTGFEALKRTKFKRIRT